MTKTANPKVNVTLHIKVYESALAEEVPITLPDSMLKASEDLLQSKAKTENLFIGGDKVLRQGIHIVDAEFPSEIEFLKFMAWASRTHILKVIGTD